MWETPGKSKNVFFSPPFLSRMCGKEVEGVCYSSSPFDMSSNSSSYEILFRAKDNLREQKLSCHQSRASFWRKNSNCILAFEKALKKQYCTAGLRVYGVALAEPSQMRPLHLSLLLRKVTIFVFSLIWAAIFSTTSPLVMALMNHWPVLIPLYQMGIEHDSKTPFSSERDTELNCWFRFVTWPWKIGARNLVMHKKYQPARTKSYYGRWPALLATMSNWRFNRVLFPAAANDLPVGRLKSKVWKEQKSPGIARKTMTLIICFLDLLILIC